MSISNYDQCNETNKIQIAEQIAKAFNMYFWSHPVDNKYVILTDVEYFSYITNYDFTQYIEIIFRPILYKLYDDYPDANKCSPKQQVRIEDDAFSLLNKLSRYRPVDVKFSYELNTWNNNDYDNNMIIVENIRNNFHDIAASLKDAVFNSIISNEKHLWIFELNKHINKDHPIFTEYKLEKLGL